MTPPGNFISRWIIYFFQELADRCQGVAREWQERRGLLVTAFVMSLVIVTLQILYNEGIWP